MTPLLATYNRLTSSTFRAKLAVMGIPPRLTSWNPNRASSPPLVSSTSIARDPLKSQEVDSYVGVRELTTIQQLAGMQQHLPQIESTALGVSQGT